MQCAAVLSKNELEVEVGKKLGTAVSTEGTKDGIFFSGGWGSVGHQIAKRVDAIWTNLATTDLRRVLTPEI